MQLKWSVFIARFLRWVHIYSRSTLLIPVQDRSLLMLKLIDHCWCSDSFITNQFVMISLLTGSFQPSHELMLRFYGFYKQATNGPCNIPKPWSWDVVGRAKWLVSFLASLILCSKYVWTKTPYYWQETIDRW